MGYFNRLVARDEAEPGLRSTGLKAPRASAPSWSLAIEAPVGIPVESFLSPTLVDAIKSLVWMPYKTVLPGEQVKAYSRGWTSAEHMAKGMLHSASKFGLAVVMMG